MRSPLPPKLVLAAVSSMLALAGTAELPAQGYANNDLMPPDMVRAMGMELAWLKTVSTPFGRQSIVDQQLHVDPKSPIKYLEIVTPKTEGKGAEPGGDESGDDITGADNSGAEKKSAGEAESKSDAPKAESADGESADDMKVLVRYRLGVMGEAGRMVDEAEANRLANNEIRRLKRYGLNGTIRMTETPTVLLYTISSDGTLERRNAETGELDWKVVVGDQRLGYGTIGVGNDRLIVTNGGNLIELKTEDGMIVDELRTGRPPRFGAIVSGQFAVLHTTGGNIEAYPLDDVTIDPYVEHVQGSALSLPVRIPSSTRVGWSTDRGYVYVMELDGDPATLFRLKTDGLVTGGLAAADGKRFFFASDAGQAYGLKATKSGDVLWVESIGEPFHTAPKVANDRVLFLSDYGSLYCLNAQTGERMWDEATTGVSVMHAAFGGKLYAVSTTNDLLVIDLDDGHLLPLAGNFQPTRVLKNVLTNRLYIVSEQGLVQCLRPADSPMPKLLTAMEAVAEEISGEDMKEENEEEKPAPSPFDKPADDPFGDGGGKDPFGAGGDSDPFGSSGGDDPFGMGGGGDDPFGGDPFN